MRTRSLRGSPQSFGMWSPAVVLSIAGASATIRILFGGRRERTVATASLPNAAVGAPLCIRRSSDDPVTFEILEFHDARWAGDGGPGTNEAAAAAGPHWPEIPRSIHQQPMTWWES
jgi:hypothetical protein